MGRPVDINTFIAVATIADLRATPPRSGNTIAVLFGATGKFDARGGMFIFDTTNTQLDNNNTVIKVPGVAGSWLKIDRHQDAINFEQFGAVTSGSFSKFIARGGYYATVKAALGTAGSGATTVQVQVNGVTKATLTFAASSTSATTSFVSGGNVAVNDGDKITFVVAAGTGAQNLALALDY